MGEGERWQINTSLVSLSLFVSSHRHLPSSSFPSSLFSLVNLAEFLFVRLSPIMERHRNGLLLLLSLLLADWSFYMIIATYLPEIVYKLAGLYWDEARCIVRCRKVDRFETIPQIELFSFSPASSVPRASSSLLWGRGLSCIFSFPVWENPFGERDFLILKRNCGRICMYVR